MNWPGEGWALDQARATELAQRYLKPGDSVPYGEHGLADDPSGGGRLEDELDKQLRLRGLRLAPDCDGWTAESLGYVVALGEDALLWTIDTRPEAELEAERRAADGERASVWRAWEYYQGIGSPIWEVGPE